MKKLLTSVFALFFISVLSIYAQDALTTSATPVKNSKGDNNGTTGSSVNLSTGEVGFPVDLVSLDGRNGLTAKLSINYSSAGVAKKVSTWNLDAPTSVVGLGWSLDYPRVVVDNQQTGTREDDVFYIYEGGENIPLQRIDDNANYPGWQIYNTKGSQKWIIKYMPSTERWEVTVESGITYVYGDVNSGRNTIQWVVKWGNWIGSSSRTTDDSGNSIQQQQASVWNLSEISNVWKDKILYEYLNVNRSVGYGGREHTEASYLRKITDVFGRVITLNYQSKGVDEFTEPHTEQSEPDAYQEVYDSLYLSSVEVRNESDKLLSTVTLGYSSIGSGNLIKRLLVSIKKDNLADASPLPTTYTYITSGNSKGKIETIESPDGKKIKYIYNAGQKVGHLMTDLTINSPGSGFAEPEVVMQKNYVLVTWRQLTASNQHTKGPATVWAKVYSWEGEWIEQDLGYFYGVGLAIDKPDPFNKFGDNERFDDRNAGREFFYTTFQDDFFAIMSPQHSNFNPWSEPTVPYALSIFYRDKTKRGVWKRNNQTLNLGMIRDIPSFGSGNNFVSVVRKKSGGSNLFTLTGHGMSGLGNDGSWTSFFNFLNLPEGVVHTATAANNYVLVHNEAHAQKTIYYVTSRGTLSSSTMPSSISFGGSKSYWYSSNSFAFVMAGGPPEYIYGWDENYSNFKRYDVLGLYNDNSPVFLNNSMVGIIESRKGKAARFDGYKWIPNSETGTRYNFGTTYAEDLTLWDGGNNTSYYTTFDPNTRTWQSARALGGFSGFSGLHARNNYFWQHNNFYYRNPSGWELKRSVSIAGDNYWGAFGAGYTNTGAYNDGSTVSTFNVKNGDIQSNSFSYQTASKLESGYETTALFNKKIRLEATQIILTRVLEEREGGTRNEVLTCPVSGIQYSNGIDTIYTSYKYDFTTAAIDPTGTVASFNKITTIPGVRPAVNNIYSGTPYGYTEQYFFNGLPSSQLAVEFDQTKLEDGGYVQFGGNLYEARVYNSGGSMVGSEKTVWTSWSEPVYAAMSNLIRKYFPVPAQTLSTKDGVTTVTEYTYNSKNLLSGTTTYNTNFKGIQDKIQTRIQYAYELFGGMSGLNLIQEPAVTKKLVNDTVTQVQATVFKNWGNNGWAAFKSYTWRGNGSSDFDFVSYSGDTDPSNTQWKKINHIFRRDEKGNVLSSRGVSEIVGSTVYGHKKSFPVMEAANAQFDELLAEDFNDENLDDNDPYPIYKTSGWQIQNGVLKSSSVTTSALLAINKPIVNTGFIADFSLRVAPGNASTSWAGFQFNKTGVSDSYTGSGSAVVLYPTGTLAIISMGQQVASTTVSAPATWHTLKVVKVDGKINVYVDGILKLSDVPNTNTGGYFGFAVNNCLSEFDNLRVYPATAKVMSTGYEKDYHVVKSKTDNNGFTSRTLLDEAGSPVATIDVSGVPTETINSSFLSDRNAAFRDDPNVTLKTSVRGKDGFYEDFETSGKAWTKIDKGRGSQWTIEEGHLKLTNEAGMTGEDTFDAYLIDFSKEYTGRVGVEMDVTFFNRNSGFNFGIALGGDAWDGSLQGSELSVLTTFENRNWKVYTNNGWSQVNNYLHRHAKKYRFKIIADVNAQKADFYIDGKLLKYAVPFKVASSGIAKLALINYGIAGFVKSWIDNITVYTDPVHSLILADADGDVIQQQDEDTDNQIFVTETLKDPLGRPNIQTKPTRVAARFGFRPEFITGVSGSGVMTGEVATANPDDEGYPYAQTEFERSPLGRVIEESKPGASYKIGSGHTMRTYYNNNSYAYVGKYPEFSYYVKDVTDGDGNVTIFVTDKDGKLIKKAQGKVLRQESGGDLRTCKDCIVFHRSYNIYESVSTYEYDIHGNLVQYNSPKYNSGFQTDVPETLTLNQPNTTGIYTAGKSITLLPGFSSGSTFSAVINDYASYADRMVYNFEGELIQKATPDNGTTKLLYDREGRVLFKQDANGARNNQVLYSVYNIFGQVLEQGYLVNQSWDTNVLNNYLSSSPYSTVGYPSSRVWRKKFSYGVFGNTLFDYDRLVKSEVNNDQDATSEVEEYYAYDVNGNVTGKGTKAADYAPGVYTINYEYNNAGQKTRINYNLTDFDPVEISYDISGRVGSIKSGGLVHAQYTYNKNGQFETENLNNGNLVRNYAYNTEGKVSLIDDPYFREELSYAGKYSGLITGINNVYKSRTGWTSLPSSYNVSYSYDEQMRLTKADNSINAYDLGVGSPVTYDANGNITFQNQNNVSRPYRYNAGTNQLSYTDNTASQLKYDANGNVISSQSKGATIGYDPWFNLSSSIVTSG
ncbi:RHS repeat domain-containing protein, partial [Arcticibacter tournemirensis]